jgi:hypothetical protein
VQALPKHHFGMNDLRHAAAGPGVSVAVHLPWGGGSRQAAGRRGEKGRQGQPSQPGRGLEASSLPHTYTKHPITHACTHQPSTQPSSQQRVCHRGTCAGRLRQQRSQPRAPPSTVFQNCRHLSTC